jgi:hypothetical protein
MTVLLSSPPSADSDPYFGKLVAIVTHAVTQSLKIYIEQRMQAQEFAATNHM